MKLIERIRNYFWNRDVRNATVAGLWIALVLAIATAIWQAHYLGIVAAALWSTVTATAVASWKWLSNPTSMPLGIVLLTLVAFAALYRLIIQQHRRMISALKKRVTTPAANAEAQARSNTALGPRASPLPAVESLDPKSFQLLRHLTWKYPEGISTRTLSLSVVMSFAQAEQLLESLEASGYIRLDRGSVTEGSSWKLTQGGRDFCTKHVAPNG